MLVITARGIYLQTSERIKWQKIVVKKFQSIENISKIWFSWRPIYLFAVKYVCYSRGDTTLRLRCPAGFRLLVEETRYGGSRWGACVYLEGEVGVGGACSQVAAEGRDCCGQTTCTVPSEPVYMPICGHNSDYLRVVYQCVEGNCQYSSWNSIFVWVNPKGIPFQIHTSFDRAQWKLTLQSTIFSMCA